MTTLAEIDLALRCAVPVLGDEAARSPRATGTLARHAGQALLLSPVAAARVAAGPTARELLSITLLRAFDNLVVYRIEGAAALPLLELPPPAAAAATKLALRGYPTELLRFDNDDGTIRWRSQSLTARVLSPGQLQLDEPDLIASFDGMAGAPIFALSKELPPTFAGLLLAGEKKSVLGKANYLDANALLELLGSL